MVCCYECGMSFKSREKEGEIQAYDTDKLAWTSKCPNCGQMGFDETDCYEDDEENYSNNDYDDGAYNY
jgi:hypothetical protein